MLTVKEQAFSSSRLVAVVVPSSVTFLGRVESMCYRYWDSLSLGRNRISYLLLSVLHHFIGSVSVCRFPGERVSADVADFNIGKCIL